MKFLYCLRKTLSFAMPGMLLTAHALAGALSMDEAVMLAVERDAVTKNMQANAAALQEQSVADNTLPDPKIKLGVMSLPTDTYDREQEPMTQLQIGFQQMFPAGDSLEIKSKRTAAMALAEQARLRDRQRRVRMDARHAWLELYYWQNAARVVEENRRYFKRLVTITQSQYAAGRQKQQDVIRAELEMGMLDDRQTRIAAMIDTARANLAKLIGDERASAELNQLAGKLPDISDGEEWLDRHPMMEMENAMVSSGQHAVELARQKYRPSWMLDVTYGKRDGFNPNGSERADFVSAMVMFDLPLFTGDRQDRMVAASRYRMQSAISAREEKQRELHRMWKAGYANWQRLIERQQQYRNSLVPKSRENVKAALYAYQSRQGEFNTLVRVQLMELETRLQALRIDVDRARAQAQLLYLAGEA